MQERFGYDPLMRLARHLDPDGNEVRMGHDPEGQMLWFTDQLGATTHYDFARNDANPRGALREVVDPTGACHRLDGTALWEDAVHWIYDARSFSPVAQKHRGVLRYITTDHLGTPQELFSEDGCVVSWRGRTDIWDRAAANDPECPIRFQGQFHDPEWGLHYNRFRHYDPDATQAGHSGD